MTELFLKLVNMSIAASWLVLAVILLRLLLKKAPKWMNVVLWALVGIRLAIPFSLESALSLIPSAETIRPDIVLDPEPAVQTGIPAVNRVVNPVIAETFAPDPAASANPLQILVFILSVVWLVGVALLLAYTAFSYGRLRRRVRTAVPLRENIYESEHAASPFVLGLVRPRIYLPFAMAERDRDYVIAHERAHIRRRDHWWKPLGFLLLTIHWFNPAIWAAYVLLCRDIELACDERVIRELGAEQRADYSQALLSCSAPRRQIAACPLAFGEVGVKARVRSVLHYKKPAFWLMAAAVAAVVAAAVCFLTNPEGPTQPPEEPFGHTYRVERVDYVAPQLDPNSTIVGNMPLYALTTDGVLYAYSDAVDHSTGHRTQWRCGGAAALSLTEDNFDRWFSHEGSAGHWWNGSAERLREDNERAWRIRGEEASDDVFYDLLLQENGDVYLTYAHNAAKGASDPHWVQFLLKLERVDLISCTAYSEGVNAYIEPAYYRRFNYNYDDLPWGEVYGTGTMEITVEGDVKTLVVSEERYLTAGDGASIERESYELPRNDDGKFEIPIGRGSETAETVFFIKIKGESAVNVMKLKHLSEPPAGETSAGTEAVPATYATWKFSPMMSATWYAAFHFYFDFDYTHIDASCDHGQLWNFYGLGQSRDTTLHLEAGAPLCWTPDFEGTSLEEVTPAAAVEFTVYDGDAARYTGTLAITRTGAREGQTSYEARLLGCEGLVLLQSSANIGATVIPAEALAEWTTQEDALHRMAELEAEDVKYISSSFDHLNAGVLAAALRGAAENPIDRAEDLHSFWDATLYLSDGYSSEDEQVQLYAGLEENLVQALYHDGKGVHTRHYFEDEALYRLLRENYRTDSVVDLTAMKPYGELLTARAMECVQASEELSEINETVEPFTGFAFTEFQQVDAFESGGFSYEIYAWDAAFTTDDPLRVPWAGGMWLDSDLRVRSYEQYTFFAVRSADGQTREHRFLFWDLYFGPDEETGRARAHTIIENAFAAPA